MSMIKPKNANKKPTSEDARRHDYISYPKSIILIVMLLEFEIVFQSRKVLRHQ